MITNLDDLCTTKFVSNAIDAKFDVDLEAFTAELNHYIHDDGDYGYDDAEKYNLMQDKRYTPNQAEVLLKQIKETLEVDKDDIRIEEIDEVPHGIAKELARDTQSGANAVCEAKAGDIRYGILRGHELIGFVSGSYWRNEIAIRGLYVREDYRKKGLSTKLLKCMMDIADEEDLKGLCMGNASWAGQGALRGLGKQYEQKGRKVVFSELEEDFRNMADLYFKDRIEK